MPGTPHRFYRNTAARETASRRLVDFFSVGTAHRLLWCVCLLLTAAAALASERFPDPEKAAVGSSYFRAYCASCHGRTAVGDGDVAQYLKIKPADLTAIAERNGGEFPLDRVLKIIDGREKVKGHGRSDMPVWGDALLVASDGATEERVASQIENLAHYVWSLQK